MFSEVLETALRYRGTTVQFLSPRGVTREVRRALGCAASCQFADRVLLVWFPLSWYGEEEEEEDLTVGTGESCHLPAYEVVPPVVDVHVFVLISSVGWGTCRM